MRFSGQGLRGVTSVPMVGTLGIAAALARAEGSHHEQARARHVDAAAVATCRCLALRALATRRRGSRAEAFTRRVPAPRGSARAHGCGRRHDAAACDPAAPAPSAEGATGGATVAAAGRPTASRLPASPELAPSALTFRPRGSPAGSLSAVGCPLTLTPRGHLYQPDNRGDRGKTHAEREDDRERDERPRAPDR